jgi:hypothetical protein
LIWTAKAQTFPIRAREKESEIAASMTSEDFRDHKIADVKEIESVWQWHSTDVEELLLVLFCDLHFIFHWPFMMAAMASEIDKN